MFYEVSALNGINVHDLFNDVAKKLTGIDKDLVNPGKVTSGGAVE